MESAKKSLSDAEKKHRKLIELSLTKYKESINYDGRPIKDLSDAELEGFINENEREEFIKLNYPAGTEIHIKCCDDCSSWKVGSHRCSCGNRRIDLMTEGDFYNGFYSYPDAY